MLPPSNESHTKPRGQHCTNSGFARSSGANQMNHSMNRIGIFSPRRRHDSTPAVRL
jgi:hypothetical protein